MTFTLTNDDTLTDTLPRTITAASLREAVERFPEVAGVEILSWVEIVHCDDRRPGAAIKAAYDEEWTIWQDDPVKVEAVFPTTGGVFLQIGDESRFWPHPSPVAVQCWLFGAVSGPTNCEAPRDGIRLTKADMEAAVERAQGNRGFESNGLRALDLFILTIVAWRSGKCGSVDAAFAQALLDYQEIEDASQIASEEDGAPRGPGRPNEGNERIVLHLPKAMVKRLRMGAQILGQTVSETARRQIDAAGRYMVEEASVPDKARPWIMHIPVLHIQHLPLDERVVIQDPENRETIATGLYTTIICIDDDPESMEAKAPVLTGIAMDYFRKGYRHLRFDQEGDVIPGLEIFE